MATFKISATRQGKRRTIYAGPRAAAKHATRLAKNGWTVIVRPDGSPPYAAKMVCNPSSATTSRGSRRVAACDITPAFKALLRKR